MGKSHDLSVHPWRRLTCNESRDTDCLTLKLRRSAQDSRVHIVLNEDKQDDKNEEDHSSNSRGDGYEKEPGKKQWFLWMFSYCEMSSKPVNMQMLVLHLCYQMTLLLTSSSFLPHNCSAICSDGQSLRCICCKCCSVWI